MEYEVSIFTTTRKIFIIEANKPEEARNIALMQINDNENMTHSSEDTNITVNPLNKLEEKYDEFMPRPVCPENAKEDTYESDN